MNAEKSDETTAKPTINDIARLSGVSKKTVSRVINRSPLLNEATRRRVDAVIQETGYIPNPQARALALRRNFLIALVHDNPNAQMVLGMQQGILAMLADTEYELIVRPVNRGAPSMVADVRAFLERQRPHGLVLLPPISEKDELAALCASFGCRYVRMGSAELDGPAHLVASNDRDAVREAVAYLIGQGHRRIGFVQGPSGFRSAHERRLGYEEALAAAGLDPVAAWTREGDYRFDSGLAAGRAILSQDGRPTAIFASNDEMAAGVLHAARERGLDVPADLSILGFDDTAIAAHLWPPLTTIRWPIAAMARAAAVKLLSSPDRVDADTAGDPASAGDISFFPSTLVHRASIAPPR
ncbi:LacI family DNA-binding transcriptional regulator [Sphingomonas montana]|uniref:LacI family DNA-binding transcriptional regulator n=1 Tax=Sphingomonas montana TaxID=1843236 RepID=UPI00096EDF7B|nr:LacI family DNA-binding transcriptional regulator [Sphingomonas montana]